MVTPLCSQTIGAADLPVGHQIDAPVLAREGRLGEPLPHELGRRLDVGRVDEVAVVHGSSFQRELQVSERLDAVLVVLVDPAGFDLVDGRGVEVVQLLAPASNGGDEVRRLQHREVLAHRLTRHVEPLTELHEVLPATRVQPVEHAPPARIGQRLEDRVHVAVRRHQPQLLICSSPGYGVPSPPSSDDFRPRRK